MGHAGGSADDFLARLTPLRPSLIGYARRALDAREEAEDVLQTAIMKTFRSLDRFTPGASFRAFVFAFLAHEVQNANRRRRPATFGLEPPEETGELHDVVATLERETAYETLLANPERILSAVSDPLARALRALSEPEREAFLFHAVGELSSSEIATIKSAPLGTILARIQRARAKLRAALTDFATSDGLLPRGRGEERTS